MSEDTDSYSMSSDSMDLEVTENETLGKMFALKKRSSSKQMLSEVKNFKGRVSDFLAKYFNRMQPNEMSLPQTLALLKYALQSPDQSAKGLSQKLINMVTKFYMLNKEIFLNKDYVSSNKAHYDALFEYLFI